MTDKDIRYRLTADPLNMERGFKSAEDSAKAFERELARLEAQERRVHNAMTTVGVGMLAGGAAIAAGLGLAAKSAVEWESAWTGVAKVVDGTPEQMADLEQQIRSLTAVLPQSHTEIANVAAAAGQLGVKRGDIAEFTKVMVNMGVATNLSSEDAAFALARMMNIMQTAPADVSRLGSAIVGLGNNFATTEAEIVAMALRISGAGHTLNMSEADVLGYAAALSSVGIEAEAGGTAISTAFIKIANAVRGGGDALDTFAGVAGMSAQEFQAAFGRDAAHATAAFIEGLGRIQKSGGDVFAILDSLNLSEIRMRDAMLRLAGAGDTLTKSIDLSNESWDENTALLAEAERRYDTTEARMAIARNSINDLAISIGQTLLPVIGEAADVVRGFGLFVADLPGPIQATLVVLAAVSSLLLLTGGAALIAIPKIAAYRRELEFLANTEGRLATMALTANTVLSKVGTFLAGPWGIAIGVAVTALTAFGVAHAKAAAQTDELVATLNAETGAMTENTRAWVANELQSRKALDLARELGVDLTTLVDAIMGDAEAQRAVAEATRVAGNESWSLIDKKQQLYKAERELGDELSRAKDKWEAVHAATGPAQKDMADLDPATRQLAAGLGVTADKADDLADELDELDKEFKAIIDRVFGLTNAQDDLEDAIDDLTEGIKRQRAEGDRNAGSFSGMSKAARENRDALQEVLEKQAALTVETIEHTGSVKAAQESVEGFRARMVELARQLGIDISQVQGYNDAVDQIERLVETKFNIDIGGALTQLEVLNAKIDAAKRRLAAHDASGGKDTGKGYAQGGSPSGVSYVDTIPAWVAPGEFIVRQGPAMNAQNRAVLEAINAGFRLPVYGTSSTSGAPSTVNNVLNVYPRTATFTVAELQLVLDQQAARERAGRAR